MATIKRTPAPEPGPTIALFASLTNGKRWCRIIDGTRTYARARLAAAASNVKSSFAIVSDDGGLLPYKWVPSETGGEFAVTTWPTAKQLTNYFNPLLRRAKQNRGESFVPLQPLFAHVSPEPAPTIVVDGVQPKGVLPTLTPSEEQLAAMLDEGDDVSVDDLLDGDLFDEEAYADEYLASVRDHSRAALQAKTVAELQKVARREDISGRSSMRKAELVDALLQAVNRPTVTA